MATITVHAGDFLKGPGNYSWGTLTLRTEALRFAGERIPIRQLAVVQMASEENVKRLGGTLGWGIAGAALFGPVGLLAGLLLGGKSKEVTFVAQFQDGRKLLAAADDKTFTELQAAAFDSQVAAQNAADRRAALEELPEADSANPWAGLEESPEADPENPWAGIV